MIFWAVVCDDLRYEITGKVSYIGVYQAKAMVPAFPATFQKLCVVTHMAVRIDELTSGPTPATVSLELDGQVVSHSEIELPDAERNSDEDEFGPITYAMAAVHFGLQNFVVEHASRMIAVLTVGNQRVEVPAIRFALVPGQSAE